jgi:hypothetical protein
MTPTRRQRASCRCRKRGHCRSLGLRREAPDASAAENAVGTFEEGSTFKSCIPIRTQVCPDSACLGMATTPSQRWKAEDLLLHQSRAANKRLGSGSAAHIDSLTAFACPKQPPALTLVVVKPLETSAALCSRTIQGDFLRPRAPKMYNLRADLFERDTESQFYSDRLAYWTFLIVPAQAIATKWLERFKEFPHRARAASFSIDRVVELAEQRSNCGAKRNGPHRCGPHIDWLPDQGSNLGPAD